MRLMLQIPHARKMNSHFRKTLNHHAEVEECLVLEENALCPGVHELNPKLGLVFKMHHHHRLATGILVSDQMIGLFVTSKATPEAIQQERG
ncbi:unnamed protein product [Sphenostylis stenocarpa]|uniref:Uncharacterized protein n=1 Tax=Sphenostylis stenocarpa TaxID=92480 RepID=A0AA86SIU5_9FABA|nr:unnamed protein product [Sphenostylis stenocarpa]